MFRQDPRPYPPCPTNETHLTVPPFTLAPIISPLVCFFEMRKSKKKKRPPNHVRSSSSFFRKVRFLLGTQMFFFARILFHHLVRRELHQILHKMLKIHICPICQDSVAFHVFFWAAQTVFLASFATLCAVFFGGLSTLQLNFDGSQHQEVLGVRCSQGKSNLQRMDCKPSGDWQVEKKKNNNQNTCTTSAALF